MTSAGVQVADEAGPVDGGREPPAADDAGGPVRAAAVDGVGEGAAARPELRLVDDREEGFAALFDEERRPMVRLAYLLVGSEALAEEIAQDGFATVYVRWSGLDNPGGFLRRCVVNGAKSALRRRALERRRAVDVADEGIDLGARELLDALATLPSGRRAVVVLRFYAGQSQDEIAEMLGMRPGTVKSSLHRGLAQLREVLEP